MKLVLKKTHTHKPKHDSSEQFAFAKFPARKWQQSTCLVYRRERNTATRRFEDTTSASEAERVHALNYALWWTPHIKCAISGNNFFTIGDGAYLWLERSSLEGPLKSGVISEMMRSLVIIQIFPGSITLKAEAILIKRWSYSKDAWIKRIAPHESTSPSQVSQREFSFWLRFCWHWAVSFPLNSCFTPMETVGVG